MTPIAGIVLLCGAVSLAACNLLDPFPTLARSAQTGQPAGERVGVCYNTMTTTLAEIRNQAQQQCAANTTAEPVDTDWYLQTCPLLLPARATFICIPRR